MFIEKVKQSIQQANAYYIYGQVHSVLGLKIKVEGLGRFVQIGSLCRIHKKHGGYVLAEVNAIEGDLSILLPFGSVDGIAVHASVELLQSSSDIFPCEAWTGRVLNSFGQPVDEGGILLQGDKGYSLHASPPPAQQRHRVKNKIDLGVRAINSFIPCCEGQRMGIFAGSGVGKSVLISMMAKYTQADVIVIGLIGERGREVQEFIEDYLGEEGLKRSVVVVATSDEPALVRRQAAYLTLTIAEYFRDQGLHVLCMIDSLTRFALAQREIGLSVGEPPTTKGYTPSVFYELPKLLERAGPGVYEQGNITGLFSVLVEGGDMEEPIADAVRGILDGHIVLDRRIADRGRYPAIDVLRSISRTMMVCQTAEENDRVLTAKKYMTLYENMEELIKIGAYKKGSDPETDYAIKLHRQIEGFLKQAPNDPTSISDCNHRLQAILEGVS